MEVLTLKITLEYGGSSTKKKLTKMINMFYRWSCSGKQANSESDEVKSSSRGESIYGTWKCNGGYKKISSAGAMWPVNKQRCNVKRRFTGRRSVKFRSGGKKPACKRLSVTVVGDVLLCRREMGPN